MNVRIFIAVLILCLPWSAWGQSRVVNYRLEEKGNLLQLTIETPAVPQYKVFRLPSPERLVVDFSHMSRGSVLPVGKSLESGMAQKIRSGIQNGVDLRVVLDMKYPFRVERSQIVPPKAGSKNYQLVIDLSVKGGNIPPKQTAKSPIQKPVEVAPPPQVVKVPEVTREPDFLPLPHKKPDTLPKQEEQATLSKDRKPLIIVDAGHGGIDPGAQGYSGTFEKHVTLSYARALTEAIQKTGKYRVMMTRDSDAYVGLKERVHMAKTNQGDLFISLHADAHSDKALKGLSVYTLSETASDKEAAELAAKENKMGMLYDVNLGAEDAEIADVLIDIIQRENANASSLLAETLISEVGREVKLLKYPHRFAGFRVLTAPDIPSLLIELGYLSNPEEEGLLNSPLYKKKVINAIVRSIDSYLKERMGI